MESITMREYKDAIKKSIKPNLKAPKTKHIRNIILNHKIDIELINFRRLLCEDEITHVGTFKKVNLIISFINKIDGNDRMLIRVDDVLDFISRNSLKSANSVNENFFLQANRLLFDYIAIILRFKRQYYTVQDNNYCANLQSSCKINANDDRMFDLHYTMNYISAILAIIKKHNNFISIYKTLAEEDFDIYSISNRFSQLKLFPMITILFNSIQIAKNLTTMLTFVISSPKVGDMISISKYFDEYKSTYHTFRSLLEEMKRFAFVNSFIEIPDFPERTKLDALFEEAVRREQQSQFLPAAEQASSITPSLGSFSEDLARKNDDLKSEISFLEHKIRQLSDEYQNVIYALRRTNSDLEKSNMESAQKSKSLEDFYEEKIRKLVEETETLKTRSSNEQEHLKKLKESEEKFDKLKKAYLELRENYLKINKDLGEKQKLIDEYKTMVDNTERLTKEWEEKLAKKSSESDSRIDEMTKMLEIFRTKESEITHTNELKMRKMSIEHGLIIDKLKEEMTAEKDTFTNNRLLQLLISLIISENVFLQQLNMDTYNDSVKQRVNTNTTTTTTTDEMSDFFLLVEDCLLYCRSICCTPIVEHKTTVKEQIITALIDIQAQVDAVAGSGFVSATYKIRTIMNALLDSVASALSEIDLSMLHRLAEKDQDLISGTHEMLKDATFLLNDIVVRSKNLAASSIEIEVNSLILIACEELITEVQSLIILSRDLQKDIEQQNRHNKGPVREFYKRENKWREGLYSAAKEIGNAVLYMVNIADKVVCKDADFEELIVASGDVAACVAQLVASARTGADPNNKNLIAVAGSGSSINKQNEKLVKQVREGIKTLKKPDTIDLTNITKTQAKKIEMNIQIRVLQLESELERERSKLLYVRKHHYNAEP